MGIVDDLVEDEVLVLWIGRRTRRGICMIQSRGLGDGVRACTPDETDGAAHGVVKVEGDVAENAL